MHPEDRIIAYPLPLLIVFLLSTILFFVLGGLPQKSGFVVSFVSLEILILFLTLEHSLFDSIYSKTAFLTLPLPLFLFFFSYHSTKGIGKIIPPYIALSLVVVFFVFYIYNRGAGISLRRSDSGAYTILYFTPFLLCIKNKICKIIALLLCLIAVFAAFKRGGIICLSSGLFVYIMVDALAGMNWQNKLKKFIFSFLPLALILLIYFFIDNYFDGYIFSRFAMIEETGGNGRDRVFLLTLQMIKESSWFDLFVGHGCNTVIRDSYLVLSAHNDFLECIYDYGLFVFAIYILIYVNLIKTAINMMKRRSYYAAPLFASVAMFMTNSMVSHILLYDWHFMTFALFWGYVIACDERERFQQKNVYYG